MSDEEKSLTELRLEREEAEAMKLWEANYKPKNEEPPPEGEPPVNKEPPIKTETDKKEPPVKPPEPPKKDIDWEQKYKTLEGKYRAEVPRFAEELKEIRSELAAKDKKIEELQATILEGKRKEVIVPDGDIDKLEAEYPGVGKFLKTIIDGYEKKIDALESKINSNVTSELKDVRSSVELTKEQQFDLEMKSLGAGDWREINVLPEFHTWLSELVPYTRFTRLEALKEAGRVYDSNTAAKMFLDFKETIKKPVPLEEKTEDKEGDKLKPFVAPPMTEAGEKKRSVTRTGYTRADYEQFMRESSRGKFNPAQWGGKTETEVEAMFDGLIAKKQLL